MKARTRAQRRPRRAPHIALVAIAALTLASAPGCATARRERYAHERAMYQLYATQERAAELVQVDFGANGSLTLTNVTNLVLRSPLTPLAAPERAPTAGEIIADVTKAAIGQTPAALLGAAAISATRRGPTVVEQPEPVIVEVESSATSGGFGIGRASQ